MLHIKALVADKSPLAAPDAVVVLSAPNMVLAVHSREQDLQMATRKMIPVFHSQLITIQAIVAQLQLACQGHNLVVVLHSAACHVVPPVKEDRRFH